MKALNLLIGGFLTLQGQQEFRISNNLSISKQCERIGNRLIAQLFVIRVAVYLMTIHGHKCLHLIREYALSDIHIPTR